MNSSSFNVASLKLDLTPPPTEPDPMPPTRPTVVRNKKAAVATVQVTFPGAKDDVDAVPGEDPATDDGPIEPTDTIDVPALRLRAFLSHVS